MLEPTRKPLTDLVELCVTGPAANRQEALDYLRGLGFEAKETPSKSWREVLPFKDEELPGVFLAGARYRGACLDDSGEIAVETDFVTPAAQGLAQ